MMQGLYAALFIFLSFFLGSCSYHSADYQSSSGDYSNHEPEFASADYASRLPQSIHTRGEKVIVVDPSVHAWGAYERDGTLVRGGLATAGSGWCPDTQRPCRTKVGTFHINSLGSFDCKSTIYPLPRGGAPMPYCMFFNGNQGLHGSYEVVEGNESHGCVRVSVEDAEWIRHDFARIGTKVIVRPYAD